MLASGRVGTAMRMALLSAATLMLQPASAQMVLPGAVAPTPRGTTQTPAPVRSRTVSAPGGEQHTPRGTPVAVPSASSLLGRTLLLNGDGSQLVLAAGRGKELSATRVVLLGEKIGGRDSCRVEAGTTSTPVTDLGHPAGLARYRVDYPACPITFEVLDGAVLVPPDQTTCDFAETDCRVRIAGLWGPSPSELGPDRVKALERARGLADTAVRSNYRALTTSTKDRPTVMGIAKDQAQFSSSREETCRDYASESRHNFCTTVLTQGRAALLHARLETAVAEKAQRKGRRGPPAHDGQRVGTGSAPR